MNVVLIAQCSKQALPATRRILDQFAERKGSRTWLTPITEAGLETLHALLRRGARRNTAVSCHVVRGGEIELLWIVGNRRKFDERGNVPTDTTGKTLLLRHREDRWRHTQSIALLASIAGLFHDFGKANALFRAKLEGSRKERSEPLRHEWVSLRLFQAFVGEDDDATWLARLGTVDAIDEKALLVRLTVIEDSGDTHRGNPLAVLQGRPVAWSVAWLICTHHLLPAPRQGDRSLRGGTAGEWRKAMRPSWISPRFVLDDDAPDAKRAAKDRERDMKKLWRFPGGTPIRSRTWRKRAKSLSRRALEGALSRDSAGSSEVDEASASGARLVHCRAGSSEDRVDALEGSGAVHCRTGSSKVLGRPRHVGGSTCCRAGSLRVVVDSSPETWMSTAAQVALE